MELVYEGVFCFFNEFNQIFNGASGILDGLWNFDYHILSNLNWVGIGNNHNEN